MADATAVTTDVFVDTTAIPGNEAIPLTETATPVDIATIINTATLATPSFTETTPTSSDSSTSASTSSSSTFIIWPRPVVSSSSRPGILFAPSTTSTASPTNSLNALLYDQKPPDDHLSAGAKAGIGIGVAALFLSGLAVAMLIVRMRKKEQAWGPNSGPPPTYEEANRASRPMEMISRPRTAMKKVAAKVAPPVPLRPEGPDSSLSIAVPTASRNMNRQSKVSVQSRRTSTLPPVSEALEEPEWSSGSNLALVYEDRDDASSTTPTSAPTTPRSRALHSWNEGSAASSPLRSTFSLEPPVPPLPNGIKTGDADASKSTKSGG